MFSALSGIFQLFQMVAAALPLIHQAVMAAEPLFPGAGRGAEKLEHVVNVVQGTMQTVGATIEQLAPMVPIVQAIAGQVVSTANAAGLFKTEPSAAIHVDLVAPAAPAAPASPIEVIADRRTPPQPDPWIKYLRGRAPGAHP